MNDPAPWRAWVARFVSADRRTLAFVRVTLGVLLLADLASRWTVWFDFYSDDGIQQRASIHAKFIGLFELATGRTQTVLLFVLLAAIYTCVTLGLFWRAAHVLAFFAWASLRARMPKGLNSGYSVVAVLLAWTSLMPMADRFSLDALRRSLARPQERRTSELADRGAMRLPHATEPFTSIAALALGLQITFIYFVAAGAKYGDTWQHDRTAVWFALHENSFTSPLTGAIRDHIPLGVYKLMTMSTLWVEHLIVLSTAVGLLWTRRIAIVLIVLLHVGFGVLMVLGPFSWACCCLAMFLLQPEDWDLSLRALRRVKRARVVVVDEADPVAWRLARVLARLDLLDLLRFEAGERGAGIAVRAPDGGLVRGRRAMAEAVAALPLGPLVAWLLASPVGEVARVAAPLAIRLLAALPLAQLPGGTRVATRVLREGAAVALVVGTVMQWVSGRPHLFEPLPKTAVSELMLSLGLRQGWGLFGPNPPQRTRSIVIDAVTVDGRHVDPITGKAPREALVEPLSNEGLTQPWLEYLRRSNDRRSVCRFAKAYAERTGHAEDAFVRGTAYVVNQRTPLPGAPYAPLKREELCSFGPGSGTRSARPPPPPPDDDDDDDGNN